MLLIWMSLNFWSIGCVFLTILNYFPNDKNLDSSKLEEFVDNIDETGRKFSKRVENTV